MIETAVKVTKALGVVSPVLPVPVGTVVTALRVVAVACTVAGVVLDELDRWDWPWSS